MSMRITTNMVMRNYNKNLSRTVGGLESARKQLQSGRRFSQSYEDPTAAAKGAVLDRRYARNGDYLGAVENTQKWQDTQESVLLELNEVVRNIDRDYSTTVMNDPEGKVGRDAYAANLRELQRSMINTLNVKYSDVFVMAGNDGLNAPFTFEDGVVKYRGLDVDDPANQEALDKMAKESSYIDLGFGLSFDDKGEVISSSAFDSALPGINIVGYGKTDGKYSNNLIVLAGQMAEVLEADEFDSEAYSELWEHFRERGETVSDQFAKLGAKTQLLEATKERLTKEKDNIYEQYKSTIGIEEEEAITNYSWAQYAYNVALKIGTSIIGPSLLDFMN